MVDVAAPRSTLGVLSRLGDLRNQRPALAKSLAGHRSKRGFTSLHQEQVDAWDVQLEVLGDALEILATEIPRAETWPLILEYQIERTSSRIDAVILAPGKVLALEFKIGAARVARGDAWQAFSYAADLLDFHTESQDLEVVPILVATDIAAPDVVSFPHHDDVLTVRCESRASLAAALIREVGHLDHEAGARIEGQKWFDSAYHPVPNIIGAARQLFDRHSVDEIYHKHADNITSVIDRVRALVEDARTNGKRTICFVTGVPGSGKTLVGLSLVHGAEDSRGDAIYLSGNGPLVAVLQEALARDAANRKGESIKQARRTTNARIQGVHKFLDHYSRQKEPPHEHLVIFDEAQRAWTAKHAKRKRDSETSEPEAFLSVLGRHDDWCAIVCLVGGGQEINTGEAGIREWVEAIQRAEVPWQVHVGRGLLEAAYDWHDPGHPHTTVPEEGLHLSTSLRTHRARAFAQWVDSVLEQDVDRALDVMPALSSYPILVTRDLGAARQWLKTRIAKGGRAGLLASSGAQRLRAFGVHLFSQGTPGHSVEHWFLNSADDVRSSNYLEIAATEFQCQGLEIDFAALCWGNDLAPTARGKNWNFRRFRNPNWQQIRRDEDQRYLLNKYRVLLTRARSGLVIWVPPGLADDPTVPPEEFDRVYRLLRDAGAVPLETFMTSHPDQSIAEANDQAPGVSGSL